MLVYTTKNWNFHKIVFPISNEINRSVKLSPRKRQSQNHDIKFDAKQPYLVAALYKTARHWGNIN